MTRFVQYPFYKKLSRDVREWVKTSGLVPKLRGVDGVKDMEVSFCPGQGWLAVRYIFNDLEDLKKFPDSPVWQNARDTVQKAPHYDSTREVHEFKGFFLQETPS